MWRRAALMMLAATLACHHAPKPARPVSHARVQHGPGGLSDDGAGDLARQSIQFSVDTTVDDTAADDAPARARDAYAADRARRYRGDIPDPDADELAGMTYAGRGYATWHPPSMSSTVVRAPHYTVGNDLRGAIEGTVTWGGAPAARLTTPCGTIDNPSVRTDAKRGLADTVVFIEHVSVGRTPLPGAISHPLAVGGSLVKRGCTLLPAAQLATPLPVELAVHADTATRVVVTTGASPPGAIFLHPPPSDAGVALVAGGTKLLAIEAGGRGLAQLPALGVTRVEAEDGASLVPAWVLSIETPYYTMTDDNGRFRIDELAPGRYEITVWHAPVVTQQRGKLEWGAPLVARQTVAVGPSTPARTSVVLGR